ncbi:MAG: ROK family protein [Bacteroidota bacterium]
MEYYIGIDIGGTSTTIGLVDQEGTILGREVVWIKEYADKAIEHFLDALCDSVGSLAQSNAVEISGIGIGAPNGNFYRGTIEYAPNMPWKQVHEVASYIQEELNCKTILTNDANAAAIGEKQFGAAKPFNDYILMTLGTGLGTGIVSGGQVIYGHDGFAGELGHSVVVPDGRDCTCGRKGCLEAYVSIRGLEQTYSELGGDASISLKDLAELARSGDDRAKEVYVKTGEWLGLKLADAATYTSPESVIFFGGIAQASDLFLPTVKETMEANIHNLYSNKIQLLTSDLPVNDAAILGSAALVIE